MNHSGLIAALATVLSLGGCAQAPRVSNENQAPKGVAEPAEKELAEIVSSVGEQGADSYVSPVLEQGLDLPAIEEGELDAKMPEPPIVVENPPIEEEFLFKSELGKRMVSDTLLKPVEETEVEPLFDHVGEQAKDEYVKAALLNQTGYNTQALEHYYLAVEKDPDNLWLKNRAAKAALFQNDLPRSQKFAEEVLAADPDNYRAMLTLATLNLVRDKKPEAREWYNKVLALLPNNIEALESMTRLAYEEKNYGETKQYAARIMEITSRNLNAILWHAEASALTGDIDAAAQLYEQLVRYRPILISRLSDMGIRLLRQERADEAKELFRRGVAMQPEAEVIRLQWEALLRETEGVEAVLEGYRQLVAEHPLDLRIHELFANYLERSNDTEQLVEQREAMLEIDPRHVSSLLSLGKVELKEGNVDEAKNYFEQAVASGPQQAATFRDIAAVYIESNDLTRAEELLQEAMIIEPSDAQNYVSMAALNEKQENLKSAEDNLKKALDLSPANEEILRMLAQFYRGQDRLDEASQIFEQVLAVNPKDASSQIALGRLYFDLENSEALDRLQKAAPLVVEDKGIFYMHYGFLAYEYGDWARARWGFEHALDELPNDLQTRYALAVTYLHLGENELAIEALKEGEEHLGEDANLRREHALTLQQFYLRARNFDQAVDLAKELAKEHPDDFEMQATLVHALIAADRKEEAGKALNDVIRGFAVKEPVRSQRLRAEFYRMQEEYDRAAGVLRALLAESDEKLDIILELAVTHGEKGDIEGAERYYEHVIDSVGDNDDLTTRGDMLVNAYNNLAFLYADHDMKLDKAEEYAEKALKQAPAADYILDTVGWVKYRQGNYEDAEKFLKKAEKLSLPDPEIYTHLGDLYRAMNNSNEAVNYYEKALALDPEADGVQAKLDALRPSVGAATP